MSGPVGEPVLLWKSETREFGISTTPAAGGGVVCVRGGDDFVYALDAQSGRLRWKFKTDDAFSCEGDVASGSSPALSGGLVYVARNEGAAGYLYALDAQSGAVRWMHGSGAGTVFSSPTAADGVVYFGTGVFCALDGDTGQRIWESSPWGVGDITQASGDGLVCIRTSNSGWGPGGVEALDARTGQGKWSFSADSYRPSAPAIADGVVYIAALGALYAVDGKSGEERWAFNAGPWPIGSPAVADGVVCFADDACVHAVDVKTHRERWKAALAQGTSGLIPAVADGTVYFGDDGSVHALDARSGEVRWELSLGGGDLSFSSPAVADGVLSVGGDDGYLYAVRVE